MDELIYKAKLAEHSGRFDDVVTIMKEVVHHSDKLTEDQRNLLNIGYRNVIWEKRAAWRLIYDVEVKEISRRKLKQAELAREFRLVLEDEQNAICKEVVELIDSILANKGNDLESKVFLLKMKGDYYRYMAEYQSAGPNKTKYGTVAIENADTSYNKAKEIANAEGMPTFHCVRLGLMLNIAVFTYEVKQDAVSAYNIAKDAFNTAVNDIDNIEDEQYQNSLEIMQLIKDNITLWMAERKEEIKEVAPPEDENV